MPSTAGCPASGLPPLPFAPPPPALSAPCVIAGSPPGPPPPPAPPPAKYPFSGLSAGSPMSGPVNCGYCLPKPPALSAEVFPGPPAPPAPPPPPPEWGAEPSATPPGLPYC